MRSIVLVSVWLNPINLPPHSHFDMRAEEQTQAFLESIWLTELASSNFEGNNLIFVFRKLEVI